MMHELAAVPRFTVQYRAGHDDRGIILGDQAEQAAIGQDLLARRGLKVVAVLEAVEAQVLVSAAGLLRVGPADNTFPLG